MEWAHDERSKINPLRDGLKMGVEMLKVRWNDVEGPVSKASAGGYRRPGAGPRAGSLPRNPNK